MRVACVLVPSFAIAVERLANPGLANEPLAVFDRSGVIDATEDLAAAKGLSLRQAKALFPHAIFVEAHHILYREVAGAMLDALESITPVVEPAAPGAAYLDVGGLDGHYCDEASLAEALVGATKKATGLLASAGVANGKFVARVAAAIVSPGEIGVVLAGREREFLQDRPVSLLPLGPDLRQRLDLLALRSLGDMAALPQAAVEAHFRSAGRRLWEFANGIDTEPLRPRKREEVLSERLSFELPAVASEALAMAGRQLLARLVRRLRGRAARQMRVQILAGGRIAWERQETFREATGDERRMALLLRTRLTALELPHAADTVVVTLAGIGQEPAKQLKLFGDTRQNMNQIGDAIRQLRARYGRPVIWRAAKVDPCSRHPEERTALLPYDA